MPEEGIFIPSTNKTPHLLLNKWLGADKPKKDDFNSDNQKVDEAFGALSHTVDQLKTAQQSGGFASAQELSALSGTVAAHKSDADMHVTQAEKAAWSGAASTDLTVGSYVGNGNSSQKITLGFEPRFGLIFAVGDGLARVVWSSSQFCANAGCISRLGCSLGLTLHSDGFTVQHAAMGGLDGFSPKFNASGATYVYFLWK